MLNALKSCDRETLERFLDTLTAEEIERLLHDWELWARDDQLPPDQAQGGGPWTTWLCMGGRGAGKTRTGAEWIRAIALTELPKSGVSDARIALVGESLADVRAIMVEGVSGILAVHRRHERPSFLISKRELVWPNGARAQFFSADDPESLRGPQFHAAWSDELAKWRYMEEAWDMLQLGLRLGTHPRQIVTTTPRPAPLIKRLLADPRTAITRAASAANVHLPAAFLEGIVGRYCGTRLGRQELDGDLIEDTPGALWRRDMIEAHRVAAAPPLKRIVVAVDPPVSSRATSDACGIVAAGVGPDGRAYVLRDATVQGRQPLDWARAALAVYDALSADRIVAEANQGGDLVAEIFRQLAPGVPVTLMHATRGKAVRAEPVAALYEQGRVSHAGVFAALEDQLCNFGHSGLSGGGSPDRLDALVWAVTELLLTDRAEPRIRPL